jgi:hypothetical protein
MESVSVELEGGLGNYLFQIAAAYSYGLTHNKKPLFPEKSFTVHKHISTYYDNILTNVIFSSENIKSYFYKEPSFNFNKIPFIAGNLHMMGYFQSEKYFNNCKEEIKQLFSYPEEYVLKIKEKYSDLLKHNTCSIHVRRGDYLNLPKHPTQDLSYYSKAIETLESNQTKFLVFSDDIEWCKIEFSKLNHDFNYIENNPDYEDLLLMSLCDNNIIANSSFSWWGAWLNKNNKKKVIAPAKWFGVDYNQFKTDDLYCEDWVKL